MSQRVYVRPWDITGPPELLGDIWQWTGAYRDTNGVSADVVSLSQALIDGGHIEVRPGSTWDDHVHAGCHSQRPPM